MTCATSEQVSACKYYCSTDLINNSNPQVVKYLIVDLGMDCEERCSTGAHGTTPLGAAMAAGQSNQIE